MNQAMRQEQTMNRYKRRVHCLQIEGYLGILPFPGFVDCRVFFIIDGRRCIKFCKTSGFGYGRAAYFLELHSFYRPDYIDMLSKANTLGGMTLCHGTHLNPGSWEAALLAAGSTLKAMHYILDGHGKLSYALVRPPGHHAQLTQADGYCFLNNAGLAVQLAVESGCKRVAVVNIDVHYGNGTAEGFYERDDVLTISLHMNHCS